MKEKIDIYSFIYNYKDTKYVKALFASFKKDMRITKNYKIDTLRDWFVEWIRYNNDMAKEFVRQLDEEVGILPSTIVEVGKGRLDTIAPKLEENGYNMTVISPYASTFENQISKIEGTLDYSTKEGVIITPKKFILLNRLKTSALMTTLPADERDINTLLGIVNDRYDVIFGAYNDVDGANYQENIERLKKLKEFIQSQSQLSIREYNNNLGTQNYSAIRIRTR